jgi:hypothetical protein
MLESLRIYVLYCTVPHKHFVLVEHIVAKLDTYPPQQKEKKSVRERAKKEEAKAAELGIQLPKKVPRVSPPAPNQPPCAESL